MTRVRAWPRCCKASERIVPWLHHVRTGAYSLVHIAFAYFDIVVSRPVFVDFLIKRIVVVSKHTYGFRTHSHPPQSRSRQSSVAHTPQIRPQTCDTLYFTALSLELVRVCGFRCGSRDTRLTAHWHTGNKQLQ